MTIIFCALSPWIALAGVAVYYAGKVDKERRTDEHQRWLRTYHRKE